ncbi:MAG: hypothetical protein ACRD0U_00955 [Acidimicrobiales bacterium]
MTSSRRSWLSLIVALVTVVLVAGCGDDDGEGGTGPTGTSATVAGGRTTSDAGDAGGTTTAEGGGRDTTTTGDGGGGDTTTTAARDPVGDLEVSLDACDYIPGGALGGGDVLNIHVFVLLIATNDLGSDPRLLAESNTGLRFDDEVRPSNQAVTVMQFTVDDGDLGRTHDFDIAVDPDDVFPETNEGNNRLSISLRLPDQRVEQVPLACR